MTLNPHDISAIHALRTTPTLPEGQDVEAMFNRTVAMDMLYRLSGRTCGTLTGLWQEFLDTDQKDDI